MEFFAAVRTTVERSEGNITIVATLLTKTSSADTTLSLHHRAMAAAPGEWRTVAGARVPGRGLHRFMIAIPADDFEWYVSGGGLVFPPGWADEKETVTVVVLE